MSHAASDREIEDRCAEALIALSPANPESIARDTQLASLEVDSLDLVELAQMLDDDFDIQVTADDFEHVTTFGDAMDVVLRRAAIGD